MDDMNTTDTGMGGGDMAGGDMNDEETTESGAGTMGDQTSAPLTDDTTAAE